MCVGIELCSKKNCLEQERCVISLKVRIEGPEVLGSIDLSKAKCKKQNKTCSNKHACEILGQCILDHPLVKADKAATKELKKHCAFNRIVKIAERLMPTLQGMAHYRRIKKKQKKYPNN